MIRTRLWMFIYLGLTWTALLLVAASLPVLSWAKPKFAKWFRMRFWPEPIEFHPKLWIHAVSMGEINIAMTLLEAIPEPQRRATLLTTATQTGHHVLIEKFGRERVRYLPWDVRPCYRRLFGSRQVPDLIVVETEIWPGLFAWVHAHQRKLAIVNGRLSAKTLRLRKNPLFRRAFGQAAHVLARSGADRERFIAFGLDPAKITEVGNIKFDFKPKTLPDSPFRQWLDQSRPLMVFASISTDEIPLLQPQAAELLKRQPDLKLLWAPRHLQDLEKHLTALGSLDPQRRSQFEDGAPRVLVLDSFGELSGCYAYADLSLVGGSFNQRGGQNFLESLQAGAPAILGPYLENFRHEADEARAAGVIAQTARPEDVAATAVELLDDQPRLTAMSAAARAFLAKHTGAVARTAGKLIDLRIIQGGEAAA